MIDNKAIRLQVALSRAGVASRRKAASIIEEGRVSVDGRVIRERGCAVNPGKNEITVDGRKIGARKKVYILLNKPKGVITSKSDPAGRKTVFDILPRDFRDLHPVGRLDKDTTGLLILTNDGALTYRLTHPKFEIFKKYRVRCKGMLSRDEKRCLERGMVIGGKRTSRAKLIVTHAGDSASDLLIEIHEGRKRQIRDMFLFLGHPVKRLERVAYEFLSLGSLKRGGYRHLNAEEVKHLKGL